MAKSTSAGNKPSPKAPIKGLSRTKYKKQFLSNRGDIKRKSLFAKETVTVRMFGNGFGMMSSEKVLATKTTPGFMKPFNDISMKGDSDVHGITGDTRLGVSATNYLFQRESHDKNVKIGNGFKAKNNIEYSRIAIVVHPNEEHYGEDSGTGDKLLTIQSEKKMATDFKQLLCVKLNKNEANSFTPWKKEHSLTNYDSFASMDSFLTDESVGVVLQSYILPEDIEYSKAYEFLRDNNLEYFFSRKADGKFNSFAIEIMGYPDDVDTGIENRFW